MSRFLRISPAALFMTVALPLSVTGTALAAPQELEEAVRKIDNVVERVHDLDRLSQAQVMSYRNELGEATRRVDPYRCDPEVKRAVDRIEQAKKRLQEEDHRRKARRIAHEVAEDGRNAIDLIRRSASWRYEGCRGGREGVQPREGHRPWGKGRDGALAGTFTVNGKSSFRGGIGHLTGKRGYAALILDVTPAPGDKTPIVNTVKIHRADGKWDSFRVAARTNPGKNRYAHFSIPQGATDLIVSFDNARNAQVRILLGD